MSIRSLASIINAKSIARTGIVTSNSRSYWTPHTTSALTLARSYALDRRLCNPPLLQKRSLSQYSPSSPLRVRLFSTKLPPTSPPTSSPNPSDKQDEPSSGKLTPALRENIYTIPNFLTATRILACPVLGYSIAVGDFKLASGLLVYAAATDLIDGWLARKFNMGTVLGTILDPAADKALMTTLTVTLAAADMIPVPLAVIILGRDVALSFTAFYYRYISLPPPKTWARYWNFSLPSAEVHPTGISKVNTALQLVLMTATVFNPILPIELDAALGAMHWIVGGTTIWSGLSYVWSKDAVKILSKKAVARPNKPS